jgi:hypothetical protein
VIARIELVCHMVRLPTDAVARYDGTVTTVEALTDRATDWLGQHMPGTDHRHGRLWWVEDAALPGLLGEMREAGLIVEVVQAGATYR